MVTADAFAKTAHEVLENYTVPYRRGGSTLQGMDSAGFIAYCLRQNGINVSFSGTNDLFRNAGSFWCDLREALPKKLVRPGVLLLHVEQDGQEPEKYKGDRFGNCDYAMICIDSKTGVYPSANKGKLIQTEIRLAPGRANILMLCKYVNYDGASSPSTPSPSAPAVTRSGATLALTSSNLRLRKEPKITGAVICQIPERTHVEVLEREVEWTRVRYKISQTCCHVGWCSSEYLYFD